MPSPKRWFPVSRDLLHDDQVQLLMKTHGAKAVLVWLEILAILDAHDNELRVISTTVDNLGRLVRLSPKNVRAIIGQCVANGWLMIGQLSVDGSVMFYSAPNYPKYHRTREPKGRDIGSPPNRTEPNRTKEKSKSGVPPVDNSRISEAEAGRILARLNLSPKGMEDA